MSSASADGEPDAEGAPPSAAASSARPSLRAHTRRSPKELAAALLGCTALLTAGDLLHVRFGIIGYPDGVLFGQAWWVAPGFALATLAFVAAAWPLAPFVDKPKRGDVLRGAAWFFGAYAGTALVGHRIVGLTSLLFGLWLYRIGKRQDRRPVLWLSILFGIGGTLGEILLHATGVGYYTERQIVNVPIWLPLLYMHGAPLALDLTRWVQGDREPFVRSPEDDA